MRVGQPRVRAMKRRMDKGRSAFMITPVRKVHEERVYETMVSHIGHLGNVNRDQGHGRGVCPASSAAAVAGDGQWWRSANGVCQSVFDFGRLASETKPGTTLSLLTPVMRCWK